MTPSCLAQPATMPDDTAHSSPPSEPTDPDLAAETAKEDADTAAARKELKHTVISDAGLKDSSQESALEVAPRVATPESDASETRNEALKEQVSSPKKKRAHDEVEDEEAADKADAKSDISTDSARDRAARAEPEKKRPRDELSAEAETTKVGLWLRPMPPYSASDPSSHSGSQANATVDAAVTTTAGSSPDASKVPKPPQTSAEKFQASGFGQLGQSSASGFSALAGTGTKSIFGSSAPTTSVFSAAAPAAKPTSPPTLSFGGAPSGASPFGTLAKPSTNGFGSSVFGSSSSASPWAAAGAKPLGGGFGGFGNGKALQGGKATKPFGAPDHESEGEEDDESEDGAEAGGDEDKEESKKEEVKLESDEKKPKLQKGKFGFTALCFSRTGANMPQSMWTMARPERSRYCRSGPNYSMSIRQRADG